MAETVDLVKIDVTALNAAIDKTTQNIIELEAAQKSLRADSKKTDKQLEEEGKSRKGLSKQMALNGEELKGLKKERGDNIKLLKAEVGSLDQLKNRQKQLIKERSKLNTTTEKGQKRLAELNAELRKNQDAINDSSEGFANFTGNIEELKDNTAAAADGFIGGMKGMIKSSLAFIATPLGATLAAIVGVFKLLQGAFQRSEASMNKVRVLTGRLSGVFNGLMKGLEPVVDFIIDNVIATFDALGTAVEKTIGFVSKALGKLGFDEAAASVDNFQKRMTEASEAGAELADAQNKLNDAMRFAQKTQLDFQKLAERQRQIRDDEALSIQERIAANEELGRVLQRQMTAELDIANQALNVAEMRIALEGESTENLDARAEALTNIADIQERVESQASEQLVNTNSLIREQTALRIEAENQVAATKKYWADLEKENADFERELELEAEAEQKQALLEIENQHLTDLEKANEEFRKKQEDEERKAAEEKKKINQQSVSVGKDLFGAYTNYLTESNQTSLDAQLAANEGNEAKQNQLKREAASKDKKIKRSQALIGAALAIVQAFAQLGPVAGAIAAIGVGISTAVQIRAIDNQKFADGGEVKAWQVSGASHLQGGIPLSIGGQYAGEIEGDEGVYVVNKRDNPAAIAALSSINEMSGRPFAPSGYMQDGGEATAQGGGLSREEALELAEARPIVVKVVDINDGQSAEAQVTANGEI